MESTRKPSGKGHAQKDIRYYHNFTDEVIGLQRHFMTPGAPKCSHAARTIFSAEPSATSLVHGETIQFRARDQGMDPFSALFSIYGPKQIPSVL